MTEIILPKVSYPVEAALEVAGWKGVKIPEVIPDYRDRIRLAINRAPQLIAGVSWEHGGDPSEDQKFSDELRSKGDHTIIGPDQDKPGVHVITTKDPAKYFLLIEQILEVTEPNTASSLRNDWARDYFEHEMAHAAGFHIAGHDWSDIHFSAYLFNVLRQGRIVPECVFSVASRLPITKLQYAMVLVNPTVPSAEDLEVVRLLGYSSPEQVVRRFEETYE